MKLSSLTPPSLPLLGLSLALCVTPALADGTSPEISKEQEPEPGCSKKCTGVDFDHANNGWGNGDQEAPGNSGDHNNAENGPGSAPGNGNGNGNNPNQTSTDDAVQKESLRIEAAALAAKEKAAQESAAAAAAASKAQAAAATVVARRVK